MSGWGGWVGDGGFGIVTGVMKGMLDSFIYGDD